jgi:hypothetical protein
MSETLPPDSLPPAESWSEEKLAQKRAEAAAYWSTPEAKAWIEETDSMVMTGDYIASTPEGVDKVYQEHFPER